MSSFAFGSRLYIELFIATGKGVVKITFELRHEKSNILHMQKPTFCLCKNKGAHSSADQCLRFRYMDGTVLLSKSEISSL